MDTYKALTDAATRLTEQFGGEAATVQRELMSLFSFARLTTDEFLTRLARAVQDCRQEGREISRVLQTFKSGIGGQNLRMGSPVGYARRRS